MPPTAVVLNRINPFVVRILVFSSMFLVGCGWPANVTHKTVPYSNQEIEEIKQHLARDLSRRDFKAACVYVSHTPYLTRLPDLLEFMGNCLMNGHYESEREWALEIQLESPFSYRVYSSRDIRNAVKFYQASYACGNKDVQAVLERLKAPLPVIRPEQCLSTSERVVSRETESLLMMATGAVAIPAAIVLSPFLLSMKAHKEHIQDFSELEAPAFGEKPVLLRRESSTGTWMVGSRFLHGAIDSFETVPGRIGTSLTFEPRAVGCTANGFDAGKCSLLRKYLKCSVSFRAYSGHTYVLAIQPASDLLKRAATGANESPLVCTVTDKTENREILRKPSSR